MNQQAYAQRFQEAASAAQRGDFAQAISLANGMLAENGKDPNALQILGLWQARQGRSGEALSACKKTLFVRQARNSSFKNLTQFPSANCGIIKTEAAYPAPFEKVGGAV